MKETDHQPKFRRDRQGKIDHIVQVFFDLVEKKGYRNVSTNQVAKEAGVSIGTIYRYFPEGKPAIFREEFFKNSENFIDFSDTIKILTENDTEAVTRLVSKYLFSHREQYALHKAYDQALQENREMFGANTENIKKYIKLLLEKTKEINPELSSIPLEATQLAFQLGIDMLDHSVHRYLFYEPIFDNDQDFINYVVMVFQLTLDTYIFQEKKKL